MTGKEWTKFTCSWFIFNALPSDLKEEREVTIETESHPATFLLQWSVNLFVFLQKKAKMY